MLPNCVGIKQRKNKELLSYMYIFLILAFKSCCCLLKEYIVDAKNSTVPLCVGFPGYADLNLIFKDHGFA